MLPCNPPIFNGRLRGSNNTKGPASIPPNQIQTEINSSFVQNSAQYFRATSWQYTQPQSPETLPPTYSEEQIFATPNDTFCQLRVIPPLLPSSTLIPNS